MIESDHKPLIPLLGSKNLDMLPPRILRFRLRLARYNYSITHVPGKLLYTADTLSRVPPDSRTTSLSPLEEIAENLVDGIVSTFPATSQGLEKYWTAQTQDATCLKVRKYTQTGWPEKTALDNTLIPYWHERNRLSLCKDLLLHGSRIVVPQLLREDTLHKIHQGQQGIVRCSLRLRSSVWWPGASKELAGMIEQCPECAKVATPWREPLITTPVPEYPWQVVGSDLFELHGVKYLLVADYLSRYPEVIKLTSTTGPSIVTALRAIFSRHGILEVLRTDNGPQYAAQEMAEFARQYGFQHVTSSPRYPQSNGFAERMVKTVKRLLKKSPDPYLAMMAYRATPMPWCGVSPSEMLMGRRIRTTLPQTVTQLVPKWPYLLEVCQKEQSFKEKQKEFYDRRHRVRDLPALPSETGVWVTSGTPPVEGRIVGQAESPRSYLVETPSGNRLSQPPSSRSCSETTITSIRL